MFGCCLSICVGVCACRGCGIPCQPAIDVCFSVVAYDRNFMSCV